jgi:3-methyladenine DNA glycosylase AlkC
MEPFKNNISAELISCFADHLEKHLASFNRNQFESAIVDELDRLELKERAQLIADQLHSVLPTDHKTRHRILLDMLHPLEDAGNGMQSDGQGIRGWGMMPLCAVVGQHGLETFDESMDVLKQMTSRFSSELDVRYFLLADQERALEIMTGWISDTNRHVRRLVSEGTRPRLPWAMQLPRLIADPSPVLPLLEKLRDDKEEYVRRSVANHLNDISKDHPDLVADLTQRWMRGADKNRKKLLRHACRTLIKHGHPVALDAFGFSKPEIELNALSIRAPVVEFGQTLDFSVQLRSTGNVPQSLVIDYLLHFKKHNGQLSAKVFKWTTVSVAPKATIDLQRNHAIRSISTRKYYEGEQALSLRINGEDYGYKTFNLKF